MRILLSLSYFLDEKPVAFLSVYATHFRVIDVLYTYIVLITRRYAQKNNDREEQDCRIVTQVYIVYMYNIYSTGCRG